MLPPHLPFGALSTSHRGYCKVFLRNYTCATYDCSTLSLPSVMLLRLHVDPCTLLATSFEHSVLVVVIGGLKSHLLLPLHVHHLFLLFSSLLVWLTKQTPFRLTT
jgi:hypothetical protein